MPLSLSFSAISRELNIERISFFNVKFFARFNSCLFLMLKLLEFSSDVNNYPFFRFASPDFVFPTLHKHPEAAGFLAALIHGYMYPLDSGQA